MLTMQAGLVVVNDMHRYSAECSTKHRHHFRGISGENTVEVYYKGSKTSAWNLRQNQAEAELSILAVPVS